MHYWNCMVRNSYY